MAADREAVLRLMRVLHVPYQFRPGELGGTEVYVEQLCTALRKLGVKTLIAAPSATAIAPSLSAGGTPISYFAISRDDSVDRAYGVEDEVAARSFRRLLDEWRPDVVHLHAFSSAVSRLLVEAARAAGAKVLFTYHTPTVSCMRGTMMYMGEQVCDGRLRLTRCTACTLQQHRVPQSLAYLFALTPVAVGRSLAVAGLLGGIWLAPRMRSLVAARHAQVRALLASCDRVVAVCGWVYDVLDKLGVATERLSLNRQGTRAAAVDTKAPRVAESDRINASKGRDGRPLRLGFFGRLSRDKGLDTVLLAMSEIPSAALELVVYAVRQAAPDTYERQILTLAKSDARVQLCAPLPASEVPDAMQACDIVVVPSRWLETGPLVVLEAFSAGVPVMGSRLGGIAELVSDGVDGLLIAANDVTAWRQALSALLGNSGRVQSLRVAIKPPRTMDMVSREMTQLYLNHG